MATTNKRYYCLFFVLFFLTAVHFIYNNAKKESTEPNEPILSKPLNQPNQSNQSTDIKTILYWSKMFDRDDYWYGTGQEIFENCAYKNCYATTDRKYVPIDKFDALIFHGVQYQKRFDGAPPKRAPNQRYIFFTLEAPFHTPAHIIKQSNNFYNWTITYRHDSDIIRTYGRTEKKAHTEELKIPKKNRTAAWFVSNCHSSNNREKLYQLLNKYIPIDVYGKCGNKTCPRTTTDKCYSMLETDYKFYLAFENSLCEDYVTEKLFNALRLNVVPIVYGSADYEAVAPPHSIINFKDFESIKELAKYLKYLESNEQEYLKYFEWKKDYEVNRSIKPSLCALCEKLNTDHEPKVYPNIYDWWYGKNFEKCIHDPKFVE